MLDGTNRSFNKLNSTEESFKKLMSPKRHIMETQKY